MRSLTAARCSAQIRPSTVSTDSDYSGEVYLTIDGGAPIRIHKTDTVSVSRSTYYTELIQTDERNFYDIVDSKFMQSRN